MMRRTRQQLSRTFLEKPWSLRKCCRSSLHWVLLGGVHMAGTSLFRNIAWHYLHINPVQIQTKSSGYFSMGREFVGNVILKLQHRGFYSHNSNHDPLTDSGKHSNTNSYSHRRMLNKLPQVQAKNTWEHKLILGGICPQLCMAIMKCKTFQRALWNHKMLYASWAVVSRRQVILPAIRGRVMGKVNIPSSLS